MGASEVASLSKNTAKNLLKSEALCSQKVHIYIRLRIRVMETQITARGGTSNGNVLCPPQSIKVPVPPFQVHPYRHSRYHEHRHSWSLGTNSRTQIVKFRGFIDPSNQKEQYHTPLPSKYLRRKRRRKRQLLSKRRPD